MLRTGTFYEEMIRKAKVEELLDGLDKLNDRMLSARSSPDVDILLTYDTDIGKIMEDFTLREMNHEAEQPWKFLSGNDP